MSKRKIGFGLVAIILLAGGTVWALRSRTDPEVERVKEKVQKLQAEVIGETMPPQRRLEKIEQVHKEIAQLNPAQRQGVGDMMRQMFERQISQHVDAYFALPPEKRVAFMDKDIALVEQMRKQWESRRPATGQTPNGQNAQNASNSQASANSPGPRPPRDSSPAARATRRVQMLDRHTPDERAKFAAYFSDMQKRRAQLGLPPLTGPRRPR